MCKEDERIKRNIVANVVTTQVPNGATTPVIAGRGERRGIRFSCNVDLVLQNAVPVRIGVNAGSGFIILANLTGGKPDVTLTADDVGQFVGAEWFVEQTTGDILQIVVTETYFTIALKDI